MLYTVNLDTFWYLKCTVKHFLLPFDFILPNFPFFLNIQNSNPYQNHMTTRLIVGGLLVDRPVLRPPFRFISWRRKAFFVLQALFSSDEFLSLALFCWNLLLHKCSERSWKQKGLDKPLRPCKLSHVAN